MGILASLVTYGCCAHVELSRAWSSDWMLRLAKERVDEGTASPFGCCGQGAALASMMPSQSPFAFQHTVFYKRL